MNIILPDRNRDILNELDRNIRKLENDLISNRVSDPYTVILGVVEKSIIETALERTFGNQAKAAKILGVNRNTLRAKVSKLGVDFEIWKV